MTEHKKVNDPSIAYMAMEEHWELPRALRRGTRAMHDAGDEYLFQAEGESDRAYEERLKRSVLYGAYQDTVASLAAKPFSRDVTVADGISSRLDVIQRNADNSNTSLTDFGRSVLDSSIDRGVSHVMVDFSGKRVGLNDGEEKASGARPYFLHVRADNLIGWKPLVLNNGMRVPKQIRVKSTRIKYDEGDGFDEEMVERVRVWNFTYEQGVPGSWEVWEKTKDQGEYTLASRGPWTYVGNPLVSMYAEETGFMTGRPALESLAELNLAHWQSYSDQRHVLRAARIPMLAKTGVTEEEKKEQIILAASATLASVNEAARFAWVELMSGVGLEHGWKDIAMLEDQMEVLGLKPLIKRTGTTTATERQAHEAGQECDLQAWARRLEVVLSRAYRIAGEMIGDKIAEDWEGVSIFKEFGISSKAAQFIDWLLKARIAGEISRGRFLKEARSLDALSADTDLEEEEEIVKSERDTEGAFA